MPEASYSADAMPISQHLLALPVALQVDSLLQQMPSASHVTFGFHSDDMTQVAIPRVRVQFSGQWIRNQHNSFRNCATILRFCEHTIALYFGSMHCVCVMPHLRALTQVARPMLSGLATAPRVGHGGLVMANRQLFRVRGRMYTQGVTMTMCPITLLSTLGAHLCPFYV